MNDPTISNASDLDLAETLLHRLQPPTTEQDHALALALDAWWSWRVKADLQHLDAEH